MVSGPQGASNQFGASPAGSGASFAPSVTPSATDLPSCVAQPCGGFGRITGHAWHYKHYKHYKRYSKSPALASLESTARANALGLWSTPTPVVPRAFRKR